MDKKIVNTLLTKFDQEQLKELVCYIVSQCEQAQQALLDYCKEKETDRKSDNHNLIIEKQLQKHWRKASEIIEMFDMYGGGPEDDEEEACDALWAIDELLRENTVSWGVRKEILDEMLDLVASDNSGFTDSLVDIAEEMCVTKEEKIYLADCLNDRGNFYYRGLAANIYLENGEDQKFLENKKANLQYGSDYLELAEFYKRHGEEEKALQTVLEGLEKADGRLDEIYSYLFEYYRKKQDRAALERLYKNSEKRKRDQDTITELMYQYYTDQGDYENQKRTLIKLVSVSVRGDLYKLYQKCKAVLKAEDFAKEEQNILEVIKKSNLSVYFDILMDKGETGEVMEYIAQNQQYGDWGIDAGHYFSKRLSGEYPRKIIEMYWKEVSLYVGLGKEKNYQHAVTVLEEIRKIMKKNQWSEEWEIRYNAFLNEHKRKKLLLKVLDGFHK